MNELKSKFGYGEWGQQYMPPYCFEFSGKTVRLVFDGYEAAAEVTDDATLVWERGGTREAVPYWCLKAADYIYMMSFGLSGNRCVTLIIDRMERLVTLDETSFDAELKPYKSAVDFGYIAQEGEEPPAARHAFTKELAGNKYRWVFCDTYWHVEEYTEDECIMYSCFPDVKGTNPYRAVKINDYMYYTMNGDDVESFCLLMNMKVLTSVSRSVIGKNEGKAIPLGAIGYYEDE
jgi:hypothetical protein